MDTNLSAECMFLLQSMSPFLEVYCNDINDMPTSYDKSMGFSEIERIEESLNKLSAYI